MEDKREAFLTALVLTSVLSIPAAAQSISISQEGSDFFESESQGRFGSSFDIEFSENARSSTLQGTEYSVSTMDTPNRTVEVYRTPEASLKISYINASYRAEKLTTPYGTLTTGVRNGRRFEKFEGLNRSKVERIKSRIESEMDTEVSDLEAREREAITAELPDLDIEVHEGETEYVNITNQGSETVDLSGWRFVSSDETYTDSFTVESVEIAPENTYTFYSGEPEENAETDAVYEIGMTLYSSSGVLEIYTDRGLKHTNIQYS